ncbi:MAG TPA: sugar phosphate nucleotidyltransferase, partial [Halococcus sp.]|nr:sugar phosphate nucleotidyltransferase [Halococcus sp.]
MQTVLLAAGEGTRMRPLTAQLPKPMLPVADRPLCAHTADAAIDAGTDELIFVVGYEADAVREYFGEEYRGIPVKYATQDEQLGTAHAVRAAREHLNGDFAVLYGDDLYDAASIKQLFESVPGISAYRAENPENYGVLDTDGDRVVGVTEKPANPDTNLVSAGACVLPAEAREWLDVEESKRGEYELTDVLDRVFAEYEVSYTELTRWMGVGRPWELLEANEWKLAELERDIQGEVSERAEIRGPVVIEEG